MTMQTPIDDLQGYCTTMAQRARAASHTLVALNGAKRNALLLSLADKLRNAQAKIIEANAVDLRNAQEAGLSSAMVDRLKLDETRIEKVAKSVEQIAAQDDPIGRIDTGRTLPNGVQLQRRRVPLGVVLIIYESRPNVTIDAAALCLKSANACILRGGKEAQHSNAALVACVHQALEAHGLEATAVQWVETTDRTAVGHLLKLEGLIDLAIPRGGESLIRAVVEQARIPVIKHYAGNCHIYVDTAADQLPAGMVREICMNAKTQRPGVCNAVETLLFHVDALSLLVETARALAAEDVQLRCCERTYKVLQGNIADEQLKPATEDDWHTEYLDKIVAIRLVDDMDQAMAHIETYGSKHTDAILTADLPTAERFINQVDTADVMVNCSTRFSDGGVFGLGAEIGISTDKLHARGPMGAAELTTYKWVVLGQGQIRE